MQYYTTYQAAQLFCVKQEKVVANTHKYLPYREHVGLLVAYESLFLGF